MERLDSESLRRNAVVAPAVLCTGRIKIAAGLIGVDRILTDALQVGLSPAHLAILREDHGGAGLAIDGQFGC